MYKVCLMDEKKKKKIDLKDITEKTDNPEFGQLGRGYTSSMFETLKDSGFSISPTSLEENIGGVPSIGFGGAESQKVLNGLKQVKDQSQGASLGFLRRRMGTTRILMIGLVAYILVTAILVILTWI